MRGNAFKGVWWELKDPAVYWSSANDLSKTMTQEVWKLPELMEVFIPVDRVLLAIRAEFGIDQSLEDELDSIAAWAEGE